MSCVKTIYFAIYIPTLLRTEINQLAPQSKVWFLNGPTLHETRRHSVNFCGRFVYPVLSKLNKNCRNMGKI